MGTRASCFWGPLGGCRGHASQALRHLGIYSPTPHCLRATSKDNNSLTCLAVFLWPEKALRQRAAGAVGSQRVCTHQWAALRGHRWGTGSTFFKGPTWSDFCICVWSYVLVCPSSLFSSHPTFPGVSWTRSVCSYLRATAFAFSPNLSIASSSPWSLHLDLTWSKKTFLTIWPE